MLFLPYNSMANSADSAEMHFNVFVIFSFVTQSLTHAQCKMCIFLLIHIQLITSSHLPNRFCKKSNSANIKKEINV